MGEVAGGGAARSREPEAARWGRSQRDRGLKKPGLGAQGADLSDTTGQGPGGLNGANSEGQGLRAAPSTLISLLSHF